MSDRYSRQVMVPEFGPQAQARLRAATILVVGAGGLGCPVLSYLAGAGIGRILLVDHDRVEETNLHRQPLYAMSDIGRPKVEAARDALAAQNPEIAVDIQAGMLTPDNADALVAAAGIVVDAADSFAVTYTLNDACFAAGKVLVSASVTGLTGYAGAFCGGGPSYRAVFPDMPDRIANCATDGVLGTAVAVVGALQAHMVLQHGAQMGDAVLSRVVTFDAGKLKFGGFSFAGAAEPDEVIPFVGEGHIGESDIVVDLRGLDEAPVSPVPGALRYTVETIDEMPLDPDDDRRIVLCCRTGLRSSRAAEKLKLRGKSRLALVAFGD